MRAGSLFYAVAVCAVLATPAAADEGLALEVGERITLKAEDMVLRQVLIGLSEAAPFTLVERGQALDQPVSFDFEAANWSEAIAVLLRREGYSLMTDGATGQPRTLVVDWDVVGGSLGLARPGASASDSGDDVAARIRAAAARLLKPRDHAAEAVDAVAAAHLALLQAQAHAAGASGAPAWEAALEAARADYASALRDLGNHDDERAVEALLPALQEDDPKARLGALEALRYQSTTTGNLAALDQVISALDTADDPGHERAALEVLVRYADPAEIMPNLEALALAEGPNQDLAAREWLRIREEQESQARMAIEGGSRAWKE